MTGPGARDDRRRLWLLRGAITAVLLAAAIAAITLVAADAGHRSAPLADASTAPGGGDGPRRRWLCSRRGHDRCP